jgi:hypothetical protein
MFFLLMFTDWSFSTGVARSWINQLFCAVAHSARVNLQNNHKPHDYFAQYIYNSVASTLSPPLTFSLSL